MPEPISFRWLPFTSTSTPPPALSMKTGSPTPTPEETASVFLASSPWERGPGISVTSRRSWAISVSIKVGFMLPPRNVEHRSTVGAARVGYEVMTILCAVRSLLSASNASP